MPAALAGKLMLLPQSMDEQYYAVFKSFAKDITVPGGLTAMCNVQKMFRSHGHLVIMFNPGTGRCPPRLDEG